MKHSDKVIRSAFLGLVAVGLVGTAQAADKPETEKCSGIVKAGKNDCGTSKTSCAGAIKTDRDAEAWILLPKGTCDRIAGGQVTISKNAVKGGASN